MTTLSLPGLARPKGTSPRARRAALLAASDEVLGERMVDLARALADATSTAQRRALATFVGLPLGEVIASPFALRMVALAARCGATTVPQELRADLVPGTRTHLGTHDARHGVFEHGFLRAGKYQQFGLEDPLALFHPEHTSKWGPHELMHRAVGFFHRADASRFERYLGARLNELVPVVTWYGPEQALRLDEGDFDRAHAGRSTEADPRRARWLRPDRLDDEDRGRAGRLLREGLLHLARELDAIGRECASGRPVTVPHPFLDASSDALAYVASHAAFLESEAADDVACTFARLGVERFDDVLAYRRHVEAVFDALLFDPIELDLARAADARDARSLWDLGQRAARRTPGSFPPRMRRWLAEAGTVATALREGDVVDADEALLRQRATLRRAFGRRADAVLANGERRFEDGVDRATLARGLRETCPTVTAAFDVDALVDACADGALLDRRRSLPSRVVALGAALDDAVLEDLARFDEAIASRRLRDAALDELALAPARWPDDPASLRFHANDAFVFVPLAHEVLDPDALGDARAHAVFVGRTRDGVSVVPAMPSLGVAFEAVRRRPMPGDRWIARVASELRIPRARARTLVEALAEAGIVVAIALPGRRSRG